MKRRLLATLVMVFAMSFTQSFAICAMADETVAATEKVSKVKIDVTNNNGKVKFSSREEEKYTVTSPTGELSCDIGETNVYIDVIVQAKQNHYFYSISKGDISFYNDKTGVKCTDVSDSDTELRLEVKISTIRGGLEDPDSAWWDYDDFGQACWEEVTGATGYTIRINDQEIKVGRSTSRDLRDYLIWGKNNTFRVKATSSKTGVKDSGYVKSDELDLTDDGEYWDDYYYDNNYYTGKPGGSVNNRNYGWIQYDQKWYFIDTNYQIKKGWLDWRNERYYLSDNDGLMLTGWQKLGGGWYFFAADGHMLRNTTIKSANGQFDYRLNNDGRMQTNCWQSNNIGWYYIDNDEPVKNCERNIDGNYYRFNEACYMITGWWNDGSGGYYYYYPSGQKAINTFVNVDGRVWRVDNNGRWDGK